MTVLYRVSTKSQDNKSPIYGEDKYNLVKLCHESFLKAKTGDEKVIYLLDDCWWDDIFSGLGEIIHYQAGSKDASLKFMFSYAKDNLDDFLFLEDDYLWTPNSFSRLIIAMPELGLISPYDHPSHFIEERFGPFEIELINGFTYRNCDSNTHTFFCRKDIFEKNYETMVGFGTNDDQMFRSIEEKLWCPTLSCATHMVEGLLAPNVDWHAIIKQSSKALTGQ